MRCKNSDFCYTFVSVIPKLMPRRLVFILFMTLLGVPAVLSAQGLPSLAKAPEITTGKLPNGISYYIATNPTPAGFADFAFVRRGKPDIEATRDELRSLPHFKERSPYRFMADHGVAYGREGFASYEPGATIYRFRNVPVTAQPVVDSTLLLMFDLKAEADRECAIVISGNVSAPVLSERMQTLSMMVTARNIPAYGGGGYEWKPTRDMDFIYTVTRPSSHAILEFTYRAPRTPGELLNTPQPLVSRLYAMTLGNILKERLEQVFLDYDAPLGSVSTEYRGSGTTWDDERFVLRIAVDPSRIPMATSMVSTVLSELDGKGAGAQEFKLARDRVLAMYRRMAVIREMTNADYADKCIASYLYGADLANPNAINAFFAGKRMDEEKEVELFNRFVSALVDPAANLTFRCAAPWCPVARETLPELFRSSWSSGAGLWSPEPADTSAMAYKTKKVKIKASAAEPVTGGQLWTFSNGMKVIYRKSAYGGEFRYALMVRGGSSGIPGLAAGESAFAGDMLDLCTFAGMNRKQFRGMLRDNGITMRFSAGATDLRITGMAPTGKLQTLLKSLLAIATQHEPDPEAFRYYRKCEDIRMSMERFSQRGLENRLDSLTCTEAFMTSVKSPGKMRDDFQERADTWLGRQFSGMENSILVLVGDLPEADVKKQLCKYLGAFRTGGSKAPRVKGSATMKEGWWTISADGRTTDVGDGSQGFTIAMSSGMSSSADNYMALRIACIALRKALATNLAEYGMYAEIREKVESYPTDRALVFVTCRPCSPDGLPAGISNTYSMPALNAVRKTLAELARNGISEAGLKAAKAELVGIVEAGMSKPDEIVNAVLLRTSAGKDFVTGYKDRINALGRENVRAVLSELEKGTRIEYIINVCPDNSER